MQKSDNGMLQRARIDLQTTAEACIRSAMHEVELAGDHILLTEAIDHLAKALDLVADFVELENK